jgi:hypothetical protein
LIINRAKGISLIVLSNGAANPGSRERTGARHAVEVKAHRYE